MGQPIRQRNKFRKPGHPWQAARLADEKDLVREYGFANKTEIYKLRSILKKYTDQAKRLNAIKTSQSQMETEALLNKLKAMGVLNTDAQIGELLNLNIKALAERRLQTIICKKMLAKTPKQARQFITHRHIMVNGKKITSPSYNVLVSEENLISFYSKSSLANEEHPERKIDLNKKEKVLIKKIREKPARRGRR